MTYPGSVLSRIFAVTVAMSLAVTSCINTSSAPSSPSGSPRPPVASPGGATGDAPGTPSTCGAKDCLPAVGPLKQMRCPPDSISLRPGRRLQSVIDANPTGTSFCFEAGTYRLKRPLLPKSRDIFVGQYGAVLSGSTRITDWMKRGAYWVAAGQTQENAIVAGVPCRRGLACNRPEGLFIGNTTLVQVTALSAVRRGRFFFDYSHDRIYVADDPRGRRVEVSVGAGAFRATRHPASNVVIKNLVIERFANPSRTGAINNTNGPGWTIANNEVGMNHGIGIAHHDGTMILNNDIHHNGQLGLSGYRSMDALVLNNEIAWNAIGGFAGWEAGGAKYFETNGLTIRGNYVHDNRHHGLWTDTDNVNTVYVGNTVVRNRGNGIFHEAALACVIRGNYIAHNGAAGILISSSSNVEVVENAVGPNRTGGIRLFIDGASGLDLAGNFIHDNVIKMREGTYNGLTTTNANQPTAYSLSKNNRFQGNSYVVPRLKQPYWHWEETFKTWAAWQLAGQDRAGTIRLL
jgi:hypothetical protein